MTTYINPQRPAPNPLVPISTLLHSTSAVVVADGQVGAVGGAPRDTAIVQVVILKNAGPATLTIVGFAGEDGTARNVVLTGSASVDTLYEFCSSNYGGLVNTFGAMTLTASVADVVLVSLLPA